MFEQLKPLLMFILPSSLICALVGLWAWRRTPGRQGVQAGATLDSTTRDPNLPLVLLVPALLIAGWSLTLQAFTWRPHSTQEWMPYVVAASGVAGIIETLRVPGLVMWLVRMSAIGGAIWVLARSSIENRWSVGESAMWVGTGVAGTLVLWVALAKSARERGGMPALLFVIAGALSAAGMLASGEIKMPMLLGGVCACVGPGLLVAMVRPAHTMGALAATPALVVGALWFYVTTLGETPWWMALLGLASMMMIPLSAAGPLARLGGWKRWFVRCALVALPGLTGLGVLIAPRAAPPTPAW